MYIVASQDIGLFLPKKICLSLFSCVLLLLLFSTFYYAADVYTPYLHCNNRRILLYDGASLRNMNECGMSQNYPTGLRISSSSSPQQQQQQVKLFNFKVKRFLSYLRLFEPLITQKKQKDVRSFYIERNAAPSLFSLAGVFKF